MATSTASTSMSQTTTAAHGDAFSKALDRFRKGLTEQQKAQFQSTSGLRDIEREIFKIQDRYGADKKLRNLNRLSKFLEAMSQLEQVVTVFLNVHEIVAFVWGPIKLVLVLAAARLETLENLLEAYIEIGEIIPGLKQYETVFKDFPLIKEVLERYFHDILEFHKNALEVFTRPAWKDVFHSAWKTFRSRFNPILASLRRHRALLLDERMTAAIIEIQDTRKAVVGQLDQHETRSEKRHLSTMAEVVARYRELAGRLDNDRHDALEKAAKRQAEETIAIRSSLAEKLAYPDCEEDHQEAVKRRAPASGEWILCNPVFSEWSTTQDKSTLKHVLYLHGKPGAGKSIMVSRIIDHLKSKQGTPPCGTVLFFYFRHFDETKRNIASMLRALLVQLLYQDDTLTEYFHRVYSNSSPSEFRSVPKLQEVLLQALTSQTSCFIILDGLDECGPGPQVSTNITDWLLKRVIPACKEEGSQLRLLISGRRDGVLDEQLAMVPSINLDTAETHREDIKKFAETRTQDILERFSLPEEDGIPIIEGVTGTSDGMFLYATVVLDNLFNQGDEENLERELSEKFPSGLDEAYDRVARRVLGDQQPKTHLRDAAQKILPWVVCAARPLHWREIQAFYCVNPVAGTCNPKKRRVDKCKVICGSFVDVEPCPLFPDEQAESVVKLVHQTAASYLIRSGRIDVLQEHTRMALFSFRYLTSAPFHADQYTEERRAKEAVLSGYYSSHDYTVASWTHHVRALLDPLPAHETPGDDWQLPEELTALLSSFVCLYKMQGSPASDDASTSSQSPELMSLTTIRKIVEEFESGSNTGKIEETVSVVRSTIETVDTSSLSGMTNREILAFRYLQGVKRYKCSKLQCHRFSSGFRCRAESETHNMEHRRPFKCPADSCLFRVVGFPSRQDLEDHRQRQHSTFPANDDNLFPPAKSNGSSKSIWAACSSGDIDAVKGHIISGANIHKPGVDWNDYSGPRLTPLVIAARKGHVDVCRLLVDHGCNPMQSRSKNHPEFSAIGEAIKRKDHELFWTLFKITTEHDQQAFVQGDLGKFIRLAVIVNAKSILLDLLRWNKSSSRRQSFATMLRQISCSYSPNPEAKELLSLLLDYEFPGVGVGGKTAPWYPSLISRDELGNTVLHLACSSPCRPVIEFLYERVETNDLNQPDRSGNGRFTS